MRITIDIDPTELSNIFGTNTVNVTQTFTDTTAVEVDEGDFLSLTSEQRKTLFGLFTDVFGTRERDARQEFTRRVLDTTSEDVSWSSSHANGESITQNEADRLIDFLRTAKSVFDLA